MSEGGWWQEPQKAPDPVTHAPTRKPIPRGRLLAAGAAVVAVAIVAIALSSGGSAPASPQRSAVEEIVSNLYSSIAARDYDAACADYTVTVQNLVVRADARLGGSATTCAAALAGLIARSPDAAQALRTLGAPIFTSVTIAGNVATVHMTESVVGRDAHTVFTVIREPDGWRIGTAASLSLG